MLLHHLDCRLQAVICKTATDAADNVIDFFFFVCLFCDLIMLLVCEDLF